MEAHPCNSSYSGSKLLVIPYLENNQHKPGRAEWLKYKITCQVNMKVLSSNLSTEKKRSIPLVNSETQKFALKEMGTPDNVHWYQVQQSYTSQRNKECPNRTGTL
jgi:hypothetical protein